MYLFDHYHPITHPDTTLVVNNPTDHMKLCKSKICLQIATIGMAMITIEANRKPIACYYIRIIHLFILHASYIAAHTHYVKMKMAEICSSNIMFLEWS